MINDATSRLLAPFIRHDSTEENMRLLWSYLKKFGRPVAYYTDKALPCLGPGSEYIPTAGRPSLVHFVDAKSASSHPIRATATHGVAFDRFWNYLNAFSHKVDQTEDESLKADYARLFNFLHSGVLSNLKFFNPRLADDHKDNYYMEREWRAYKNVEFASIS